VITKAIIQSINDTGTRCVVRMPLFESPGSNTPVVAEAPISITPGIYNNLAVEDIVLIAFEENALEKPVILGKLFRGADVEGTIRGGGGIFNTLKVNSDATLPASTLFIFPASKLSEYKELKTPKKMADYIKWLEGFTKKLINQLDEHFRCFKNWTQWQLRPENVEIDDGDLDTDYHISTPFQYQDEGSECKICGQNCTKDKTRCYLKLTSDNKYPNV
jgi:hypothetical protein